VRKLKVGSVAAIIACAVVIVQSAAAVPPTQETASFSGTSTVPAEALCDFPIVVDATITRTRTTFFNSDGSISGRAVHGVEQDTFFANGRTLVGDPYHFQASNEFENGVIVSATLVGVFTRVHLPDGGVFIVAGTLDIFQPGTGFFTVDKGNSGNNIDAFCAALS
jgi:hypothetical protein